MVFLLSLLRLLLFGLLLRAQLTLQRTVEGAGENTISPRTPDRERGRHHKSTVRAGKRYFLLSCCTSTPSSLTSAISSSSSMGSVPFTTYTCTTPLQYTHVHIRMRKQFYYAHCTSLILDPSNRLSGKNWPQTQYTQKDYNLVLFFGGDSLSDCTGETQRVNGETQKGELRFIPQITEFFSLLLFYQDCSSFLPLFSSEVCRHSSLPQ